jgi:glycosyltransferase involved in cell wall biosynthesis
MKRVLTFCDYYLPGFKAGGPIRSISNLIARLDRDLRFSVVTRDRDQGDGQPYAGIEVDRWHDRQGTSVYYMSPQRRGLAGIGSLLRETPHDVVYLNSFWSPAFTIPTLMLRRLGRTPRVPVVLAPRGEFSPGALQLSRTKKQAYLAFARGIGLYRGINWHASSEKERADILRSLPATDPDRIHIVPPVPPAAAAGAVRDPDATPKREGELNAVFLSRIAPMKNLEGALDALMGVEGNVELHVYGPQEDPGYWSECERLMKKLPQSVRTEYHGHIEADAVRATLAAHDLLLLPTRGENFGHVILESLLSGCPVLISDRTPWRGLEAQGAGWDLPLEDVSRLRQTVQRLVDMGAEQHAELSRAARRYGVAYVSDEKILELNRALFLNAV